MMRLALCLLVVVAAAAPTLGAEAQRRRVPVRVVDVSGGRAYVEPGAVAGISRGDRVLIERRRYEVVGVTASYATIEVPPVGIALGARGFAIVRRDAQSGEAVRLDPPRPISAFRGQWPDLTLPASEQQPEYVPLGVTTAEQRLDLALGVGGAALVPLDGRGEAIGQVVVRAQVHAEPIEGTPLSFDADAAFQAWMAPNLDARAGRPSQPYLRVRELQIAYGQTADFYAALGRLRYAASTVGQLDGLRLQSPSLSGITVGAFGGFVPDPIDGVPSFDASRFGLEAQFRLEDHALRPMVSLVGHGSLYDGAIDERRLTATVDMFPGDSRIGAHAELNLFDSDNVWGADPVELTAAGVDGTLRLGVFRAGARFDMRRPERSRWLATYLPPSWLCARAPGAVGTPTMNEACTGQFEPRLLGSADVGVELDRFAVTAGGTLIHVGDQGDLDQLGGWVSARTVRLFGVARADLTVTVQTGQLIESYALSAGVGAELVPGVLDVSIHYRPALTRYRADIDRYFEHMVGGGVLLTPMDELDISLDVDALTSRDIDALLVLWRPRLF
jgi:hypothetical protein